MARVGHKFRVGQMCAGRRVAAVAGAGGAPPTRRSARTTKPQPRTLIDVSRQLLRRTERKSERCAVAVWGSGVDLNIFDPKRLSL